MQALGLYEDEDLLLSVLAAEAAAEADSEADSEAEAEAEDGGTDAADAEDAEDAEDMADAGVAGSIAEAAPASGVGIVAVLDYRLYLGSAQWRVHPAGPEQPTTPAQSKALPRLHADPSPPRRTWQVRWACELAEESWEQAAVLDRHTRGGHTEDQRLRALRREAQRLEGAVVHIWRTAQCGAWRVAWWVTQCIAW